MFGKHFASMYSGSLFGKPASVFAVWGYVIATMRPSRKDGQCYVELNPSLLASTFASTEQDMLSAIGVLCSPDPRSRTKAEDGRRLLPLDPDASEGPMQFRVVNGSKYRALRDEEERRAYLREAKRKERASTKTETVNHGQPPSSQAEVEVEVEVQRTDPVATAPAPARIIDLVPVAEIIPPGKGKRTTAKAPGWTTEAGEDWEAASGGVANFGRLGKALGSIVARLGWETVRPAWQAFLVSPKRQFGPEWFSANAGDFTGESVKALAADDYQGEFENIDDMFKGA